MEICPAYISKINSDFEKQIIVFIIQKKGWNYLVVKEITCIINRNNILLQLKANLILTKKYVKIRIFLEL